MHFYDGECNEGTIWELAMLASSQKFLISQLLLTTINGRLLEGVMKFCFGTFERKWEAFGWHTEEIDGHNFEELSKVFRKARDEINKPSAIIAHTIKGKV